MTEALFPFKPDTYDSVKEITAGMRIAVHAESKGECENCGDTAGLLYYYETLNAGRLLHWFTDKYGGIKQQFASLKSVPCSTCRPNQPLPTLKDEDIPWWD